VIALAEAIRNARLQAIASAIDAAAEPGTLSIYSLARPAPGAAITNQVKLAVLTFGDPCAASIDQGLLTFAPLAEVMAIADGAATWGRVADGAGAWVLDGTVGVTDSGADFEINNVLLYEGGIVRVTSAVFAEPLPAVA
jgi:hypothetical protein